ncbi:Elastin microfibril interface-located protein 3 [Collichthys lucidus]|uniref:Elastin microfibril interface-located protein 3 n=1 Tax=Collichthys lucidus TaxID=240159 RepID=A0A4U5UP81_COLLU|nr:Elastin microfibril interface-located protein 3 [Collichthys lucidus]
MHFAMAVSPFVLMTLFMSSVETKFYRPYQFNQYKAGLSPHHEQGKPTSRHKNHCAYVVEKTMSYTVQDGAAPYVKAEYNKCSWGQKCPTLQYRLMYKPLYKVAHKTVTELEWRCCPGFSGYGCMEGHPVYQHPMKMMPPFKGPPMKGPQFKGPQYKGPMFKGPPVNIAVKANPWSQSKGLSTGGFNSYPMHHFGPPRSSSYPETSFETYPSEPEPMPEHQEPHHTEHDQEHEHEPEHGQGPEEHIPEEIPTPPPSGGEQPEGRPLDSETEERIFRMEEDVQRLNQGLETLRGTVNGLEDSLRASLREDANRMLSALLSAGPGPVPAPALASNPSTVGFVEIPGGDPDTGDLDGRHVFPGLTELNGRVEELRTELQAKTAELQELKSTVMGHDGALKKMSNRPEVVPDSTDNLEVKAIEKMMDAKLSEARTEILGGFEKRVETAEGRCEEKAGDVHRQCQREQGERQEQMEDSLKEKTTDLRTELRNLQAQMHELKTTESCCGRMSGLVERVQLLETSVAGLNQSQGHLKVELGGHKDHIEGILEGRLGYVEAKLNLTGQIKNVESGKSHGISDQTEIGQALEAKMEGKLRALEGRLLTALEELSNATAPALLEGHAVPTLETELESIRERLEVDVDRVQKQLSNLEILCSSSCSSPQKPPSPIQQDSAAPSTNEATEQHVKEVLDMQDDRLNSLNVTLQNILRGLKDQQEQAEGNYPIEGELRILKFNVRSVNHTLRGLQDSLGTVVQQVGQTNSSWHEREARLAQQIKGVVQLVGHQASMLGSGERRLTRLKGELQEMKRRLAQEVQGCRSTAMGVKKEVTEVRGHVASVEDQCKGLTYLAEDLERIREELEGQSSGLLLQVNGTLSSHAQQLSELRGELRNCTSKAEPTQQSLKLEANLTRGDNFTLN